MTRLILFSLFIFSTSSWATTYCYDQGLWRQSQFSTEVRNCQTEMKNIFLSWEGVGLNSISWLQDLNDSLVSRYIITRRYRNRNQRAIERLDEYFQNLSIQHQCQAEVRDRYLDHYRALFIEAYRRCL